MADDKRREAIDILAKELIITRLEDAFERYPASSEIDQAIQQRAQEITASMRQNIEAVHAAIEYLHREE